MMTAKLPPPAIILAHLLFLSCGCSTRHTIGCNFFPEREPATCEQTTDGNVTVWASSLARSSFGFGGFDAIFIEGREGIYFVSRRGKTARAFLFDNGPDNVVEGLARTQRNGKVGFVDANLDEVVPAVWDFASPFENGVAVVCAGCVPKPMIPHGEHTYMAGGKWGYIDKHGKVVIPVIYDEKDLPPNQAAAGLVKR